MSYAMGGAPPGHQLQQMQPMPPPPAGQTIPGCPPGLEYLSQVDQLVCKSKVELLQALTDIECANQYLVRNSMGQSVFRVGETTGACMRVCCGSARGFQLHVYDNYERDVMRFKRAFKYCAGCCWFAGSCGCCTHELVVEAPVGTPIGYVRQLCTGWTLKFEVLDAQRERVFVIQGPCCPCGCGDVDFAVLDAGETQELGRVTKQWTGAVKEAFTEADNFAVAFPLDLDVKLKATLLGALFLVDFLAFENNEGLAPKLCRCVGDVADIATSV